ncbi:MAG: HK97 gp10 family phage protein [Peptostreptococcaceae bacterium]|nr:HK97 gp10 family phage protein [Peptostreptococcaceae bacterium]
MANNVNYAQLDAFRQHVKQSLTSDQVDLFMESCAKELAARLLAKVIKRTPVRKPEDCPPGVKGGTLRRGWTAGQNAKSYVDSLHVNHYGGVYVIEIKNPVEYASYVEFGHRKRNHSDWVEGKFMLTISEQEIQANSSKILESKLKKKLGECFK